MKHNGSCLCQTITFEVLGNFEAFFLCHCSRCRKVSGSAHGANLFSASAQVKWLSGSAHVKTYRLPNTRFAKSFCDVCGAALPTVGESHGITVPAGILDSDVDRRPDGHLHTSSRANWDHDLERVKRFEGLPE